MKTLTILLSLLISLSAFGQSREAVLMYEKNKRHMTISCELKCENVSLKDYVWVSGQGWVLDQALENEPVAEFMENSEKAIERYKVADVHDMEYFFLYNNAMALVIFESFLLAPLVPIAIAADLVATPFQGMVDIGRRIAKNNKAKRMRKAISAFIKGKKFKKIRFRNPYYSFMKHYLILRF